MSDKKFLHAGIGFLISGIAFTIIGWLVGWILLMIAGIIVALCFGFVPLIITFISSLHGDL
jgi:hypothetical protein